MIDTIKLAIPLTHSQFNQLYRKITQDERWQWVQYQPVSGDMRFLRIKGLMQADQASYHREIHWDIPDSYTPPELEQIGNSGRFRHVHKTFLTIELSLPKFRNGHNIHLLYDFIGALRNLKINLQNQLHCRFTSVANWKVLRVDICYAWRLPDQQIAQQVLDSLKRIHYPRKKPIIYPTSIVFVGATYSLKFYLKHPEFINHDKKALVALKAPLEWINDLERLALGVLRVEATLRRKYLVRQDIQTVKDLARPLVEFYLDEDLLTDKENADIAIEAILAHNSDVFYPEDNTEHTDHIEDNQYFTMPVGSEINMSIPKRTNGLITYQHKGGGFTVRKRDNPTSILQYFINKFLGENRGMDTADEVETKLLAKYKQVKATRLTSFWLYVQKFGSQKAKESFGRDSYDRAKRELKVADVSLIEPPRLVTVNREFLASFRFDLPSPYVTNRVDDVNQFGKLRIVPSQPATEQES